MQIVESRCGRYKSRYKILRANTDFASRCRLEQMPLRKSRYISVTADTDPLQQMPTHKSRRKSARADAKSQEQTQKRRSRCKLERADVRSQEQTQNRDGSPIGTTADANRREQMEDGNDWALSFHHMVFFLGVLLTPVPCFYFFLFFIFLFFSIVFFFPRSSPICRYVSNNSRWETRMEATS